MKVLVSACLLGLRTRYDGKAKRLKKLFEYIEDKDVIPICPEQLGGMSTPRPRSSIKSGDGVDVLAGRSKVETEDGADVSDNFIRGAEIVFEIARITGASRAILNEKSPSCGVNFIVREGEIVKGKGVTAALLEEKDIEIISAAGFKDKRQ